MFGTDDIDNNPEDLHVQASLEQDEFSEMQATFGQTFSPFVDDEDEDED